MLLGDADLTRVDPRLVDGVVAALVRDGGTDPESLMLVGAQCRNVWSAALGRPDPVRRTHDLDFGVAVDGMDAYRRLTSDLTAAGHTGIQYRVSGMPVDLMPFGVGVEQPAGLVEPPTRRGEPFNVFGFVDVHRHSVSWELPSATIRVASPAGYTLLKVSAWHDRITWGESRDGVDLAEVIRWYVDSPVVEEHLWEAAYDEVMAATDYDLSLAAAHAAGACARRVLSPHLWAELERLWGESRDHLPRVAHGSSHLGGNLPRTSAYLEWFGKGLSAP